MEHNGIGFNLQALSGRSQEEVDAFASCIGKAIKGIRINPEFGDDGSLEIQFEDGSQLDLYDDARSCCEYRYLVCDDDLGPFLGKKFMGVVAKSSLSEGDDDVHETDFLDIVTSDGSFGLAAHNEHNGYYGGIYLRAKVTALAKAKGEK